MATRIIRDIDSAAPKFIVYKRAKDGTYWMKVSPTKHAKVERVGKHWSAIGASVPIADPEEEVQIIEE